MKNHGVRMLARHHWAVVWMSYQPRSKLEKEQEEWRKNERRKKRAETTDSKAKYNRGTMATDAIASSMAKKAGESSIVGIDRAYSNKEHRKNKCSHGMPKLANRIYTIQPIYHEDRLAE